MARESEIIPARIVDKDDENVGSEIGGRRLFRGPAASSQGKDDRQGEEDPAQGHVERVRGDYSGAAE